MSSPFSVELDMRAVARAKKTLDKYRDRSLAERMRRAALQATRVLLPSVRAAAPVGATRNLQRSVKASQASQGIGGILGPKAPHRHLVIQPHRIVTPGGRDTGRRTTGNPFVDIAVMPRRDAAIREMQQIIFGP